MAVYPLGSDDFEHYEPVGLNYSISLQFACYPQTATQGLCDDATVITVPEIRYHSYLFTVAMQAHEGCSGSTGDCYSWMADVQFYAVTVDPAYSKLVFSFRLLLVLAASAMIIIYLRRMKGLLQWQQNGMLTGATYEQRWILLVLGTLILFNDPLYIVRLAVNGWFVEFIYTMFDVCSDVSLLFFWLIMMDKIKRVRLRVLILFQPFLRTVGNDGRIGRDPPGL